MPTIIVDCVEAEYAFNQGKPIVPLRLQSGYKPDGWLGLLSLPRLYYDFSNLKKFDEEWSKLCARLQGSQQQGAQLVTISVVTALFSINCSKQRQWQQHQYLILQFPFCVQHDLQSPWRVGDIPANGQSGIVLQGAQNESPLKSSMVRNGVGVSHAHPPHPTRVLGAS